MGNKSKQPQFSKTKYLMKFLLNIQIFIYLNEIKMQKIVEMQFLIPRER